MPTSSIIRTLVLPLVGLAVAGVPVARSQQAPRTVATEIRLLVRADDMGAAQAVNEGCIEACRSGIARSAEVIVPGPWFLDAVRLLKENPDIDVGVHLTLTSEWERVKWRPLTHAPSLVDADGYFRPMTTQRPGFPPDTGFVEAGPNLDEVERELRAQIETAKRHLGDRVTHVSSHMMAAVATPELKALTERIAAEHKLKSDGDAPKPAGSFGTNTFTSDQREKALTKLIEKLKPGDWLIVEHPAFDTPETRGLGHTGYENVAQDRSNVRRALTSPRVVKLVKTRGIKLIGYDELTSEPAVNSSK